MQFTPTLALTILFYYSQNIFVLLVKILVTIKSDFNFRCISLEF